MTDVRPILDRINAALAECDAAKLPPLVKLTREQLDQIRAVSAHPPAWLRRGAIPGFSGVPIKLVDTVEESTPYELRQPKATGGIVSGEPPVILGELGCTLRVFDAPTEGAPVPMRGWLRRAGRWFGWRW